MGRFFSRPQSQFEVGMDWIIHLDTDELLHPAGSHEYSLRKLLSDVPSNVDMGFHVYAFVSD
ncbi:hypothetical protein KSP40_PGU006108 [Platanthera guangdongensis]|uniref:Glycosyltransferase family 92 protein n=1 Tax=Platanthera guangdongensis TaxID=2320717 RepID=A0ABR2M717_9ASPA